MAITRTAMIDDDGSGTTGTIINNAWKQEFYNQIDGAVGGLAIPWTPVDGSTAGLALTVYSALYTRIGKLVCVWGYLSYPATANGLNAKIAGLPVANGAQYAGCFQVNNNAIIYHVPPGAAFLNPTSAATGGPRTNAEMSGAILIFQGMYLTD